MIDGNLKQKEIEIFLKNTNNSNLLLFSTKKPNKKICAYFDKKIIRKDYNNRLGFTDIYKIYNRKIPYEKKVELFRRTGVSPHIILKTIVSSTRNIMLIKRLVNLEQYGFPTYESLTATIG